MAIKAMVLAMVDVIGRPLVWPMLWMPMSSRGIQVISLKGINYGHMIIVCNRLTELSQETKFGNCSL